MPNNTLTGTGDKIDLVKDENGNKNIDNALTSNEVLSDQTIKCSQIDIEPSYDCINIDEIHI